MKMKMKNNMKIKTKVKMKMNMKIEDFRCKIENCIWCRRRSNRSCK